MLEHLWDEITRGYGVHTLCGYVKAPEVSSTIIERICAEHSGAHGWSPPDSGCPSPQWLGLRCKTPVNINAGCGPAPYDHDSAR